MKTQWWSAYKNLELCGGTAEYISDDCEDMIEINYPDGMQISVGCLDGTHIYEFTVVAEDTTEGWKEPLEIFDISDKNAIYTEFQRLIYKYRNNDK